MNKADIINKVYQLDLSKRATLVVFYLINRANNEFTCFPGIKTIARECNMSARTVQRALGDLEEVGLVKKESRFHEQGGQRSNMYYLQDPQTEKVDEVEEVSFESYKEDVMYQEVLCDLNVTELQSLSKYSSDNLKSIFKSPYSLLDHSIELHVSRGDSHYDSP